MIRRLALAAVLAAATIVPLVAHAFDNSSENACLVAATDASTSTGCQNWSAPAGDIDQNISAGGTWTVTVQKAQLKADGTHVIKTYSSENHELPVSYGLGTIKHDDVVLEATATGAGSYVLIGTPNDIAQRPGR